MVDQAQGDLAGLDGVQGGEVVRVHLAVGLQPLEPLASGLVTLQDAHAGDERLEGGVGGCEADLALPLGLHHVVHAVGDLRLGDLAGVVRDDAHPPRQAHPVARPATVGLVHLVEARLRQLRQHALLGQGAERTGVLREEQAGLGAVALLQDLRGQFGAVAVAHLDLGADGLLQLVEDRLDQLLVAPGVDDEGGVAALRGAALVVTGAAEGEDGGAGRPRRARWSDEPRGVACGVPS